MGNAHYMSTNSATECAWAAMGMNNCVHPTLKGTGTSAGVLDGKQHQLSHVDAAGETVNCQAPWPFSGLNGD